MEYQVLIYCIIDSAMMPPAVLPPVLSAERRVAACRSVARLPARSTSKTSTSLLTSQRLLEPALKQRSGCLHGSNCTHTHGLDVNVVLLVCPSSLSIILSPRVTVMKCLGRTFFASFVKNEAISCRKRVSVPGSRGSGAREGLDSRTFWP